MADEFTSINSPLGKLKITCSIKGVTRVKFVKENSNESPLVEESSNNNTHLKKAIEWFSAYFEDPSATKTMDFPELDLDDHSGKSFICKVWQVLRERVGPGETISYGELAMLCGSAKAARAVGQAMKTNPFTILVPCHRVINSGGKLGNYSGGVDKKKWLLKHEGKNF